VNTGSRREGRLLMAAMVIPFVLFRVYLHSFPNTDLNVGNINVHHLFSGFLLVLAGGIPLALQVVRRRTPALLIFGAGISLVLDEWVFLIATNGSNEAYLTRPSWLGGAVMIALACTFTELAARRGTANTRDRTQP